MDVPALVGAGAGVLASRTAPCCCWIPKRACCTSIRTRARLERANAVIAGRAARDSAARTRAFDKCHTADGTRIAVVANLGAGADEAAAAVAAGAEGCGLLRTEFLFLDRDTPPSEDEQAAAYQAIAQALDGRPFKIRTFDIGGDKPLPYLPMPPEENPALGLRGIRAALRRSDLLRIQLAAILRVTPAPRIMLPMIASLSEVRAVRAVLERYGRVARDAARHYDRDAGLRGGRRPVRPRGRFSSPSAPTTSRNTRSRWIAANAQLAPQIDAFHPAVLSLIAQAAAGAASAGQASCGVRRPLPAIRSPRRCLIWAGRPRAFPCRRAPSRA